MKPNVQVEGPRIGRTGLLAPARKEIKLQVKIVEIEIQSPLLLLLISASELDILPTNKFGAKSQHT